MLVTPVPRDDLSSSFVPLRILLIKSKSGEKRESRLQVWVWLLTRGLTHFGDVFVLLMRVGEFGRGSWDEKLGSAVFSKPGMGFDRTEWIVENACGVGWRWNMMS